MKTVLVLLFIFAAAFAAPAEDQKKAPEAPVVKKEEAAAPAPVLKEAEGPESRLSCPTDWSNFGQRCYSFVQSPMDWQDAESHCRGLGAHLTSATSVEEYTFLQQLTRDADQSVAWMGGFYMSEWMWMANDDFKYNYWGSSSTFSSYPCMYLHIDDGWRNSLCSSSYRFICSF